MANTQSYRFVVALALVAGLLTFFQGFLPLKTNVPGFSVPKSATTKSSPVSRLVIMVVDALRTDFISVNQATNWPYLNELVKANYTKLFNATAHPPTVTLPRIKVIVKVINGDGACNTLL